MRHATAGVLPAFCAAFAASVAAAQSPPAGHSTAVNAPRRVNLAGAEDDAGDATEPPSQPPRFPSDRQPPPVVQTPSVLQPATPALVPEEETGWIRFDQFRASANILHDSPDGLGIIDINTSSIFKTGIPGVTISPQVGSHYFGSTSLDNIPDRTYDISVELTGGIPINDDWIIAGGISPGIFTDFEGGGGDLFRIPARVLAFYKYSETLKLGAGVLYLDRPDVNVLPLVGLSYIPNDHFNAELWFPRPKVSWRYMKRPDFERWIYVVGEFGGGAWNIRMDDGSNDQFAYRDYRAMVGIEQRAEEGFNWFAEGGLIFGRQLSFNRSDEEVDLDKTAGVQFGLRF
ncbi:MAG TPA: DUF6268 family outer membrane beta-barrel protein [Caulifigura sp.]|nr:DUF6268 family outer membrane beta-barrel protein [Caulifigura sp.]